MREKSLPCAVWRYYIKGALAPMTSAARLFQVPPGISIDVVYTPNLSALDTRRRQRRRMLAWLDGWLAGVAWG